jgi:SepF-like predicted cell division protein (DUF552 family)
VAYGSGWFDLKLQEVRNAKTLLQAETTKLEAEKQTLVSETAKLEASRIKLGMELEQLTLKRSEQQSQLVITTNELQILRREQAEKERLIQTLSEQLTRLAKENEATKPLVAEINTLRTQRDEFEKLNLQLRQHLAVAYEHGRNTFFAALNAAQTLVSMTTGKGGDAGDATGPMMFAVGKWRSVYESDYEAFRLKDFSNAVQGIVDTNTLKKLEAK